MAIFTKQTKFSIQCEFTIVLIYVCMEIFLHKITIRFMKQPHKFVFFCFFLFLPQKNKIGLSYISKAEIF